MMDDLDQPPRAYTTADVASQPEPSRKRMGWRGKATLSIVSLLIVAVLGFAAYVWTALHYTYSSGDRAGFVQKFSKKGWLCKTWEGEIAMANLPGTHAGDFRFLGAERFDREARSRSRWGSEWTSRTISIGACRRTVLGRRSTSSRRSAGVAMSAFSS